MRIIPSSSTQSRQCSLHVGRDYLRGLGFCGKLHHNPAQRTERESCLGPWLIERHLHRCSTSAAYGHGNLIERNESTYWGMEVRLAVVGAEAVLPS